MRAADWWEFKLPPALAIAYATAFLSNVSIFTLWPRLLLLLVALAACAAYVSVINDLTDLEDDQASGKANRLVGKSGAYTTAVLAGCLLPGAAVAFLWRAEASALWLYLGPWAAFTLYSVPPVRLKGRGVLGLLADASGAHLFPALLAVALVYRGRAGPADTAWLVSVAVWSLSLGLRGILWHQLGDRHNDETSGVRTFAQRHELAWLQGLGHFVIFPAEMAAFVFMLWHASSRLAVAFLGFYALLTFLRKRAWGVYPIVVVPKPRRGMLMHEYYEVFFPLAFLLSSAGRYPVDALLLVPHFLLFPKQAAWSAGDTRMFVVGAFNRLRRLIRRPSERRLSADPLENVPGGSAAGPPGRSR